MMNNQNGGRASSEVRNYKSNKYVKQKSNKRIEEWRRDVSNIRYLIKDSKQAVMVIKLMNTKEAIILHCVHHNNIILKVKM